MLISAAEYLYSSAKNYDGLSGMLLEVKLIE
jgi:hypothetical protein